MTDYYQLLGISKRANAKEIKEAYKKLALRHHPDKNPGNAQSEELFKRINEAYNTLSHPEKRRTYDLRRSYYEAPSGTPYSPPGSAARKANTHYNFKYGSSYNFEKHRNKKKVKPEQGRTGKDWLLIGSFFMVVLTAGILLMLFMNSYSARTYFESANEKYLLGDYSGAVEDIAKTLHFDDNFYQAYALRAAIYQEATHNHSQASKNFRRAAQLAPPTEAIRANLWQQAGVAAFIAGMGAQAEECLAEAMALGHAAGDTLYFYRAQTAAFLNQDYRKALSNYEKIDAASPYFTESQFGSAYSLHHLQNYTQALVIYTRLIEAFPHNARYFHYWGLSSHATGHTEEACMAWTTALNIKQNEETAALITTYCR